MKNVLIAMALGLIVSVPAHAVEPKPVRTMEPAPTTATSDLPSAPKKPTRYCVMVEPRTGSRIWDKVCQTRDAWLKEGFDPIARR